MKTFTSKIRDIFLCIQINLWVSIQFWKEIFLWSIYSCKYFYYEHLSLEEFYFGLESDIIKWVFRKSELALVFTRLKLLKRYNINRKKTFCIIIDQHLTVLSFPKKIGTSYKLGSAYFFSF